MSLPQALRRALFPESVDLTPEYPEFRLHEGIDEGRSNPTYIHVLTLTSPILRETPYQPLTLIIINP